MGDLYFGTKNGDVFEDLPKEEFVINRKNYSDFIKYFNHLPKWEMTNIKEIEKNHGKNLVFK